MVDLSTFQASSEDSWLHKKRGVYAFLLQACPSSVVYDQGFIGNFIQKLHFQFEQVPNNVFLIPTSYPLTVADSKSAAHLLFDS
jgi:hypothetical protein